MNSYIVRHLISNLRRHFNIRGEEILACYDTALVILQNNHLAKHVTVSVSPSNWKKLADRLDLDHLVKHPDIGVVCIKLFGKLYVRSESRVADDSVKWVPSFCCYTPTMGHLLSSMEKVIMGSKSTKKQVAFAENMLAKIKKST